MEIRLISLHDEARGQRMATQVWGDAETQYFYSLTPEKILSAVESMGFLCTGRVLPLNSMENRVYEVELELPREKVAHPRDRFRIAKFYRPGRWSREQILDEHQFLFDLQEAEIPAVAPLRFADGSSLAELKEARLFYALFPKVGGRSPDELSFDQLEQIGRLLARLHQVGAARKSPHRLHLNVETFGRKNLESLLISKAIPPHLESRYAAAVEKVCQLSAPLLAGATAQRIHGDCHLGNLLMGESLFWVDFDDMCVGPPVQDFWLLILGRDDYCRQQMAALIEGYSQMRSFDVSTLSLIETLRALRWVHFSAWIQKRWNDPAFPLHFPNFGTPSYWQEQTQDLEDQLQFIETSPWEG